jgi:hypothetical protein
LKSKPQKYMQVNDLSVVKPHGPPAGEAAIRPAPAAEAAAVAACTVICQGGPVPPQQCGNAAKQGAQR